MATTRSSFPIDFDLYNADEEQALFITDDVAGQDMSLEIINTSDKPTSPKILTGKASVKVHHFELIFRPGSVYNNPAAIKSEGAQFEMFMDKDSSGKIKPNADGTLSLFFKSIGNWTLQEGEKVVIKLSQIRAAAQGGTRGTRLMLRYQNLLHAGNTEPFSGFREMHLNIINQRGRKQTPLFAGFVGSNTVLNDGDHPNSLRFRITNIARKNKTLDATKNSKMILSFDAGPSTHEWTLATSQKLKGIVVKAVYPDGASVELRKPTGTNEWTIPFKKMEKNQFIDLQISAIVTKHAAGQAHMYIHYEDIPGYWNGQLVCVIEKSPLVTRADKVGIGTSNPQAKLEVNGKTTLQDLKVNGKIQLEPSKDISVNFGFNPANQKLIEFKTKYNNDPHRGQVHLYAPSNYYTNKPAITLAGNYGEGGKVGIGNPKPEAMLHVLPQIPGQSLNTLILGPTNKSNLRLGYNKDYSVIQSFKSKPLAINPVDNNVGIGTQTPSQKLDVAGNIVGANLSVARTNTTRGALYLAASGDFNHALYNNYSNVDGEGSWDGVKWNVYNGLNIRIGGASKKRTALALNASGNLGIGTTSPPAKLTIVAAKNGRGLEIQSPSAGWTHFPWTDNWNYISGNGVVFRSASGVEKMRVDLQSGNVGIGTTDPKTLLHVNGHSAYSVGNYGWLNSTVPTGIDTKKGANPISILASHRIAANEFNAFSDQRIKNIVGRSNTQQDLNTLRQLEVTDFTYIDRVAHGDQRHKKLIAQQVQAVYPQAVNTCKDFVPDIYAMSVTATYDSERQQLTVTTPQAHALTQGDRVRIADEQGTHELEVREVIDGRTFTVAHNQACEHVFVYGKEVDDFETLDYEEIAMLNLSATQELSRQMEALKQENAALKAEVEALKMAV